VLETIFSQTKPRFLLEPLALKLIKNIRSPHRVPSSILILLTQEQIIHFSKSSLGVARFEKQYILNSHQNNFCSQNAVQDFKNHYG
jgi:hypothetical protein